MRRPSLLLLALASVGCNVSSTDEEVGVSEHAETTAPASVAWSSVVRTRWSDALTGLTSDASGAMTVAVTLDRKELVRRFSADGTRIWERELVVATPTSSLPRAETHVTAMSMRTGGETWVIGWTMRGTWAADSKNAYRNFVAKLGADGGVRFAKELDASLDGLSATPDGGVVLRARFAGPVVLPGLTIPKPTTRDGGRFVVKLDAGGTHVWNVIDTGPDRRFVGLGTTSTSDVVVSGVGCSPTIGGVRIDTGRDYFCDSLFVVKLAAADGRVVWGRGFTNDGIGSHLAGPLVVTSDDGVVIAGDYKNPPDFGQGKLPAPRPSTNAPFTAKLDANGDVLDATGYPELPRAQEQPLTLTVLGSGKRALAGFRSMPSPKGGYWRQHKIAITSPQGVLERSFTVETEDNCAATGYCGAGGNVIHAFAVDGLAPLPNGDLAMTARYAFGLTLGGQSLRADNKAYAQHDAWLGRLSL